MSADCEHRRVESREHMDGTIAVECVSCCARYVLRSELFEQEMVNESSAVDVMRLQARVERLEGLLGRYVHQDEESDIRETLTKSNLYREARAALRGEG